MSSSTTHASAAYRWQGGGLEPLDEADAAGATITAADSWLVTDGRALALGLHRQRFFDALPGTVDAGAFWDSALAAVPHEGEWFPRVELQERSGEHVLVFRLRSAPALARSVVVATAPAPDARTSPLVKGPDLAAMAGIRAAVEPVGAEEAVILSPDGYVVEGAYSALVWWRGAILCAPSLDLARIDSVTARSLLGLATALGTEIFYESVTPAELDGTELWALSALHGPRIVTAWIDGPETAELPGRLEVWRTRLAALRKPIA